MTSPTSCSSSVWERSYNVGVSRNDARKASLDICESVTGVEGIATATGGSAEGQGGGGGSMLVRLLLSFVEEGKGGFELDNKKFLDMS